MSGPNKLAEEWLPNLTPEQRASWLKTYAPPAAPASPPGRPVINATLEGIDNAGAIPTQEGGIQMDRALRGMQGAGPAPGSLAAVAGPAGAAPYGGGGPPPADAPASAYDNRQPKNGDWAGAQKAQDKAQADGRAANLAGATFYKPTTGDTQSPSGGAPVLVSKGGRTPASWTTQTQEGNKLTDDTKDRAEHAEGSKMDAAAWGRNAGVAEANREVAILDQHARIQAAHADELRQRGENQRQRVDAELAKLNAYTSKVQKQEIDPDLYFKQGGGAGGFAAALAVFAGAVGQGFMARAGNLQARNVGLDALNDSIRENIDVQKANAANSSKKLEDQRSLLGVMTHTFGEGERAEQATWIQYLEHAKTRLASAASEAKSDWAQARYRDAIANIDGEIAGRREKWDQMTQDHVTRVEHDVNAPAQYAGGAGAPIGKRDREEISEISKELTKAGIPQARSALADIDRSIDTFGEGDIAGVGPMKDHIPSLFISDEGVRNRQAVAHVKNGLRKEVAGASLTDGEKVELNKELEGAHDAPSLRRVVQSFRQSLHKKEVTIRAGGSDLANAEFDRRQGTNEGRAVPLNAPSTPHVKAPE